MSENKKTQIAGRELWTSVDSIAEYEDVPAPELGENVVVRIRALSDKEIEDWQQDILNRRNDRGELKNLEGLSASLLVKCVVDESGDRIFKNSDIEMMRKHNCKLIQRLLDAAMKLNGLTEEGMEVMRKNLSGIL